jgi:hypothetical protein
MGKKNKKDIDPILHFNKNGKFHGYQEWYSLDDIWLRGVFKNDDEIGYLEDHITNETIFYII